MATSISIVNDVTDDLVAALQRLVPQLTENHPPPSRTDLAALVHDQASTLLVARNARGVIVGALTLAVTGQFEAASTVNTISCAMSTVELIN